MRLQSQRFLPRSRRGVVLKINITYSRNVQRWSLQGQLVGQWAAELRLTWSEKRHEGDTRRCIVELIDVTFVDQTGEAVLAEIMSQGAELVAGDVYTKPLLQNLRSDSKRTRMKRKQDGGGNHG